MFDFIHIPMTCDGGRVTEDSDAGGYHPELVGMWFVFAPDIDLKLDIATIIEKTKPLKHHESGNCEGTFYFKTLKAAYYAAGYIDRLMENRLGERIKETNAKKDSTHGVMSL